MKPYDRFRDWATPGWRFRRECREAAKTVAAPPPVDTLRVDFHGPSGSRLASVSALEPKLVYDGDHEAIRLDRRTYLSGPISKSGVATLARVTYNDVPVADILVGETGNAAAGIAFSNASFNAGEWLTLKGLVLRVKGDPDRLLRLLRPSIVAEV